MLESARSFKANQLYSRTDIQAALGGSTRACLVTAQGHLVAVCFQAAMNPRGPERIYVGLGKSGKVAMASAKRPAMVRVFRKEAAKQWRYLGVYAAQRYSEATREVALANQETGRRQVAGVLHLRAVRPSRSAGSADGVDYAARERREDRVRAKLLA